MISEMMKNKLIEAGLSKQQASSVTAEAVVNFLMNEEETSLLAEAHLQVEKMSETVASLRHDYETIKYNFDTLAGFLRDIVKAQEEHGGLTDERARNTVALYAALLNMNERAGARGKDSVENAGYVTYAYLGGQARRDVHYGITRNDDYDDDNDDDSSTVPHHKHRKRF